jgi:hypothetical protein
MQATERHIFGRKLDAVSDSLDGVRAGKTEPEILA